MSIPFASSTDGRFTVSSAAASRPVDNDRGTKGPVVSRKEPEQMDALIYFAVWAGLIFLMMRFGCGKHVMGHGRHGHVDGASPIGDQNLVWVPPEKDADPVCGKTVKTEIAKPSVFNGSVYYFCSRQCREVFEAAPDVYVGGKETPRAPRQLEHTHA